MVFNEEGRLVAFKGDSFVSSLIPVPEMYLLMNYVSECRMFLLFKKKQHSFLFHSVVLDLRRFLALLLLECRTDRFFFSFSPNWSFICRSCFP
jgi:hypothetical protein